MEGVDHILNALKKTLRLIEEDNPSEIKELSNEVIGYAALNQDPDNIIVAVLIYSIAKTLERDYYKKMEGWNDFYVSLTKNLNLSIKALEKNSIESVRVYLGRIRNSVNKIESNLGNYIRDVFRKAEINKAFKLYQRGLSSEQTANLLGISLWDLSSYIGSSNQHNQKHTFSMPVKKRIKIAEDIFGWNT